MRITIDKTPEQVALIKSMGVKERSKSLEAQEAFAAFISTVIQTVLQQANNIGTLFRDLPYDEYSRPSIPLDLYHDINEKDYIKVWSQSVPGGLPTQMVHGIDEMMVATYPLTSAESFLKDYAKQGRLDVVSKALERMAQEFLLKQEYNAASIVFRGLAEAQSTKGDGTTTRHVIRSNTAGKVILEDFSRLITLGSRLNSSWVGGTPVGANRGLTDLVGSPEFMEKVRSMAYEPLNTDPANDGAVDGSSNFRDSVYNGASSFYGVNIMEAHELGMGYPFTQLFESFAGSTTYDGTPFTGSNSDIVLGIDSRRDALLRPVLTASDNGGTIQTYVDEFQVRSEKIGYYSKLREGRVLIDDRALVGLIY